MNLTRHVDGRIVAAHDNHGRNVSYTYDSLGRLITVADLAGGSWRFEYHGTNGEVAAVQDPRSVIVLDVDYQSNRVLRLRALANETTFQYRVGSTQAVDSLGLTTIFQHSQGLTNSITNPSGISTRVSFDRAMRPVTVVRNQEFMARMSYDSDGRLSTLRRPGGESRYRYGSGGLESVSGTSLSRYQYDAEGRVTEATDHLGTRAYLYSKDGGLRSITVDGVTTKIRADRNGIITNVSRNGTSLITYTYDVFGRVASTTYLDGVMAIYGYNERGLRDQAIYRVDDNEVVAVSLNYDAAGNLTHHAVELPSGEKLVQDYEVGDRNEVKRINNSRNGNELPAMSFDYDDAGRMHSVKWDPRSATVKYDDLDRVQRVTLDGESLLDYDHGLLDHGVMLQRDRLTENVLAPSGTSAVFGTMDSIFHTRPRPTDYGPVAYSSQLKTFLIHPDYQMPDAVLLSGLARRMIPLRGEDVNTKPLGQDKPSNSLFIPPEFHSVNCYICSGGIFGVQGSVGNAVAGRPTGLGVSWNGFCSSNWLQRTQYGDGTSGTGTSIYNSITMSHIYRNEGTRTATGAVECTCESAFFGLGYWLVTVYIEAVTGELAPPGTCTESEHRALQNIIDEECTKANRCYYTDECDTLRQKNAQFGVCRGARQTIVDTCFRGIPDPGHKTAIEQTHRTQTRCREAFTFRECSGSL